jgi:hypothetical protein
MIIVNTYIMARVGYLIKDTYQTILPSYDDPFSYDVIRLLEKGLQANYQTNEKQTNNLSSILMSFFASDHVIGRWFEKHLQNRSIKGSKSKGWVLIYGKIIESQVERKRDSEGKTRYYHKLSYVYTIHGEVYTSNKIQVDEARSGWFTSQEAIQGIAKSKYQIGHAVNVYYNPIKPDEAVLKTGIPIFTTLLFSIFALVLFGAMFSL